MKPVLGNIDVAIQRLGHGRRYDLILDVQSGLLVYALDKHNLTEELKEEITKPNDYGKE